MKKTLVLISIMFLASCATQYVFDVQKANTYLMSHKTRPGHIQEALSVGKLAQGMNEEEVKICWGNPDRIEKRSLPGHGVTIWRYLENRVVAHNFRRSITKKMLSKEVTFRNGSVINWREIDFAS
jgi:hypothetical protein